MRGGWEKYLNFRCTGCGNCCKGTYLMVTDADVRRIIKGSKRPLDYFLHFRPVDDIQMSQTTPWGVKMNTRRMLMTVKWRGGHCKFLDDDNRCTIYTHRPAVCRSHPFTVTMSDTWFCHGCRDACERTTKSRQSVSSIDFASQLP